jgi:phage terminase small subunit
MLTPKARRFVAEYLVDLNQTAAAIRTGYSPKSAHVTASRLMDKPAIKYAIAQGQAAMLARAELSAVRVLEELRRLAFVNPRSFFDHQGNALAITDLPIEAAAAIAGFEVIIKNATAGDGHVDTIHKIKLADKVRTLEILARHFKLLVDQIALVDPRRLESKVAAMRKRLNAERASA